MASTSALSNRIIANDHCQALAVDLSDAERFDVFNQAGALAAVLFRFSNRTPWGDLWMLQHMSRNGGYWYQTVSDAAVVATFLSNGATPPPDLEPELQYPVRWTDIAHKLSLRDTLKTEAWTDVRDAIRATLVRLKSGDWYLLDVAGVLPGAVHLFGDEVADLLVRNGLPTSGHPYVDEIWHICERNRRFAQALAAARCQTEKVQVDGSSKHVRVGDIKFAPILAMAEVILESARRLADWQGDRHLDETGAGMLLDLAGNWLKLEAVLDELGVGAEPKTWAVGDDARSRAAGCLRDIAKAVRENNDWFRMLPDVGDNSLVDLAPEAVMGMPHKVFSARLGVVVDLLREVTTSEKRQRMTVDEANAAAMRLADTMGPAFFNLSERQQAEKIGCHWNTWRKTPLYKAGDKRREKAPGTGSRSAVSLTPRLEAITGQGEKDQVLKELIEEQERDFEPSPMDPDDSPTPDRVHHRKTV
jgi:hypothetical protein